MRTQPNKLNNNVQNTTVHTVIISDASGSMSGEKYKMSEKGILAEYELCKSLGYKFSLVEFAESGYISENWNMKKPPKFIGAIGRNTPLYKTIYNVLNYLNNSDSNERFLIKIFTDGQNNTEVSYLHKCIEIIKGCESSGRFTITFSAYQQDLSYIMQTLGVHASNCIAHKNTGESVKEIYETSYRKTLEFDQRLKAGEDVTFGFYKSITE